MKRCLKQFWYRSVFLTFSSCQRFICTNYIHHCRAGACSRRLYFKQLGLRYHTVRFFFDHQNKMDMVRHNDISAYSDIHKTLRQHQKLFLCDLTVCCQFNDRGARTPFVVIAFFYSGQDFSPPVGTYCDKICSGQRIVAGFKSDMFSNVERVIKTHITSTASASSSASRRDTHPRRSRSRRRA